MIKYIPENDFKNNNNFLIFSLTGSKVEKLQDFLSRLFEPPQGIKMPPQPLLPAIKDNSQLQQDYEVVMDIIADKHENLLNEFRFQ